VVKGLRKAVAPMEGGIGVGGRREERQPFKGTRVTPRKNAAMAVQGSESMRGTESGFF